jgi:RNA polymerase sigma-70 factor (ECF subfamily)
VSCVDLANQVVSADGTPSRTLGMDETVAAILSSLGRLTEDQREVVRLRFLEGHAVSDVAAQLNKSESAVHMLCHRGLAALRDLMVSITRYMTTP